MPLPPESHRLQPDHLPTPFSAAQIREGCPAGRTIRLREEVSGQQATYRRIRFTRVDDETAVHEVQVTDEVGMPIGEPTVGDSTWLDLQRHASQPADATSVQEVALALPFGNFDCWLYTVRTPDGDLRFWFARDLPGMPVQVEEWVEGSLAGRTTVIANDQPAGWGSPVDKDESVSKSRG
jgi:hypothetical protein